MKIYILLVSIILLCILVFSDTGNEGFMIGGETDECTSENLCIKVGSTESIKVAQCQEDKCCHDLGKNESCIKSIIGKPCHIQCPKEEFITNVNKYTNANCSKEIYPVLAFQDEPSSFI